LGKLGDGVEKRNETKHKGEGDKPKHPRILFVSNFEKRKPHLIQPANSD
jgi:hypothetical protein